MAFMILPVLASRRAQRRLAAPAALGLAYYRDQR
jgi:hypothetical protein